MGKTYEELPIAIVRYLQLTLPGHHIMEVVIAVHLACWFLDLEGLSHHDLLLTEESFRFSCGLVFVSVSSGCCWRKLLTILSF